MTKQTTRQKHDKQRAEKRKHEHETEEMTEHAARKRRAHVEETIAIIVMLTFVPFMVFGAIFWPGTTGSEGGNGGTGLQNGTYTATYLGSRPATGTQTALANLDVNGNSVFVTESDLSGNAAANSIAFFQGYKGEPIQITVKNGFISWWAPVSAPK
jgi:hypothetical protein